jgi:cell division protein FtsB
MKHTHVCDKTCCLEKADNEIVKLRAELAVASTEILNLKAQIHKLKDEGWRS